MTQLLTFYSDSHKEFYEKYFLESFNEFLKDDFSLNTLHVDQLSTNGAFGSSGFEETMLLKIKHIINNIDITSDDKLVYADCDIQFFQNIKDDLFNELGDYDIKFQDDVICLCAGFFICKQNKTVLNFFKQILLVLENNMVNGKLRGGLSDQIVINNFYNRKLHNTKIGKLPKRYFTVASSSAGPKQWTGQPFNVPPDIILHHANWTVGYDNKIKLLNYIKDKIKK
tara:strand:+ start:437 stop:1114 length:678 start_codon:yes stop_codon:yes gene_type:complete